MDNVIDLTELKTMLGLADDTRDALLNLIIKTTVQALRFKLALAPSEPFPSDLSYIALEVCVKRFKERNGKNAQTLGRGCFFDPYKKRGE